MEASLADAFVQAGVVKKAHAEAILARKKVEEEALAYAKGKSIRPPFDAPPEAREGNTWEAANQIPNSVFESSWNLCSTLGWLWLSPYSQREVRLVLERALESGTEPTIRDLLVKEQERMAQKGVLNMAKALQKLGKALAKTMPREADLHRVAFLLMGIILQGERDEDEFFARKKALDKEQWTKCAREKRDEYLHMRAEKIARLQRDILAGLYLHTAGDIILAE